MTGAGKEPDGTWRAQAADEERDLDLEIALRSEEATGDTPDIWLDPAVAAQIAGYAETDTTKELGGVLLGELQSAGPRPIVRVLAALEAKHTEAVQTSVKFTHDTWDDIHREREARFPHLRIVGWFHTHPGFGVFLSSWDLLIQHNFFNLPWQVAYVVDPVAGTSGFFRWEAGKVVPVQPPAGTEPGPSKAMDHAPLPAPDAARPDGAPVLPAGRNPGRSPALKGAALGAVAGASLTAACLWPYIHGLEAKLDQSAALAAADAAAAQADTARPGPAPERTYTVRPGDSLWSIAETEYGDGSLSGALGKANRIPNPDRILAGKEITLPDQESLEKGPPPDPELSLIHI